MIFNASHVDVEVTLPERAAERRWHVEIYTAAQVGLGHATCDVGALFYALARSFVLLRGTNSSDLTWISSRAKSVPANASVITVFLAAVTGARAGGVVLAVGAGAIDAKGERSRWTFAVRAAEADQGGSVRTAPNLIIAPRTARAAGEVGNGGVLR